jgi:hypothetical protein
MMRTGMRVEIMVLGGVGYRLIDLSYTGLPTQSNQCTF